METTATEPLRGLLGGVYVDVAPLGVDAAHAAALDLQEVPAGVSLAHLVGYGDAVVDDVGLAGVARVDAPEQRGVGGAGV